MTGFNRRARPGATELKTDPTSHLGLLEAGFERTVADQLDFLGRHLAGR